MRQELHSFFDFALRITLVIGVTHCGKTSFDKGSSPSGTAAVIQTAPAASNDRDVEASEPADTVASEPVAIGGAFLACSLVQSLSTADEAVVQCEFASETREATRAQDLRYAFVTGGNRSQGIALLALREDFVHDAAHKLWIWRFHFARTAIRESWLFVEIQDKARPLDPIIKSDVAIPAVPAAVEPAVNSTPAPASPPAPALFTFRSGAQKLGDDGAGIGVETGCGAIDKPTIAMARSRSYALTLTVETSLTLVFSDLCGVGTGATNTLGSFTTAALRSASNAVIFQFNLVNQSRLTYVSAKVPAGAYTLVVTPASRNGALNDFVYSDLLIEGAGITVP